MGQMFVSEVSWFKLQGNKRYKCFCSTIQFFKSSSDIWCNEHRSIYLSGSFTQCPAAIARCNRKTAFWHAGILCKQKDFCKTKRRWRNIGGKHTGARKMD